MKCYHPYSPFNPTPIYAEQHVIENGKILLNHIPYVNSIEIEGFKQTTSALISPGQFYCNYNADTYYREADCIVYFNQQHDGQTVSVDYMQVGTVITATDLNEVKEHLENGAIHNRYTLPPASIETRGGIRVGQGLSIIGDILSATAKDYTLPPATRESLGGVFAGVTMSIEGGVLDYYLPTASATQLGGVKVGSGLTIVDGVLSANTVTVASDEEISDIIQNYFASTLSGGD